ncbi:MAG: SHOCT domain-containing protein [Thermomicrobiales bacterium]|nr:SHOCT domain-containing protein [Thermomicrobiales bacterium]MCO5223880.1 SHOCT domain-containing protein [Thermomicrobiales bacterium]
MGLLGTAAKAYVATRVVGSTHRRQQQRWAAQDQDASAPATNAGTTSVLDQLTQLGQLRDAGILTEAEFEAKKQMILAG